MGEEWGHRTGAEVRTYRPQLDSLRALAVAAVLYSHFWSVDTEFAELGVRLFFVLSGFLLTGILLNESDEARRSGVRRTRVLLDFYGRRILRIWPAYYFVLIAAVTLGATSVERTFSWHALYATNILLFLHQDWYPLITRHLWTLSVEEQFYFVLPFGVLFVRRALLKPALIGFIAAAIAFRGIICVIEVPREFYLVLPISQFDALGGGALLALLQHLRGSIAWKKLFAWSLPTTILWDVFHTYSALHYTFIIAAYVLPMAAIVSGADAGIGGCIGRLLSSRPLVMLGRISYGIYLYHIFVGAAVDGVMQSLGYAAMPLGPARFVVLSCFTLAAAAASWLVLERPALSLRRYFRRATETAVVGPAAPTSA